MIGVVFLVLKLGENILANSNDFNYVSSIVGPFVGAFLAFQSSRIQDKVRRYREHLASANLALLCIKNQLNDFLLFRRSFREDIARSSLNGNEPIWALIRPSLFTFGKYEFDYKSIGFLFENSTHKLVFDQIEHSQMNHRSFVDFSELKTKHSSEVQQILADFQKNNSQNNFADMEFQLGASRTTLSRTIAIGLALRCENNEKFYLNAFHSLSSAFEDYFKGFWSPTFLFISSCNSINNKLIKLSPMDKSFSLEELPSIPNSLQSELNLIPRQNFMKN